MTEAVNLILSILQNPIITIMLVLIAPTSFIYAIINNRKNRKYKSLQYCLNSELLINDFSQKIYNLEIKYLKTKIDRLMVSKIVFWNNGSTTINSVDIPDSDKLSIQISNQFEILDVYMVVTSNESNKITFDLSSDKKAIHIDFDYLDKKDGFILQIFHTANDYRYLEINGYIKSYGKINSKKIMRDKSFTPEKIFQDIIVFLISSIFAIFLIFTQSQSIKILMIIYLPVLTILVFWKLKCYYTRVPFKFWGYMQHRPSVQCQKFKKKAKT